MQSDGSAKECKPRKEVQDELREDLNFLQELNQTLAGPQFPGFDNPYKVVRATRHGLLELEDGQLVLLAGLDCNHQDLKKYLDGVLVKNERNKIVFVPTGLKLDNQIFAYVWEVTTLELSDIEVEFAGTFSPTNENTLSNKWCEPLRQDRHRYHQRYVKIAERHS